MLLLCAINFTASFIAFCGTTFAIFSRHVVDGVWLKKALASLAIGFVANAINPTFHSLLWIVCSLAAVVMFIAIRCAQAFAHNKKPVFIV